MYPSTRTNSLLLDQTVTLVSPVTPKVPAIEVLPFDPVIVNLFVLTDTSPVTPKLDERVVAPVTPRLPPRIVAPELTVKVLDPVTVVLPLTETAPVPVENAPAPI